MLSIHDRKSMPVMTFQNLGYKDNDTLSDYWRLPLRLIARDKWYLILMSLKEEKTDDPPRKVLSQSSLFELNALLRSNNNNEELTSYEPIMTFSRNFILFILVITYCT